FVVVGALACVFIARPAARPRQQPDTLARVLTVLAVLAVLWQLLLAASWTNFHEPDDLQGYFVFPTKMLALGSLGEDPFSERRAAGADNICYWLRCSHNSLTDSFTSSTLESRLHVRHSSSCAETGVVQVCRCECYCCLRWHFFLRRW